MTVFAFLFVFVIAASLTWFAHILSDEGHPWHAALCVIGAVLCFVALVGLVGCSSLPPPDGPDTTQKWDSNGNANFGPAATCQ